MQILDPYFTHYGEVLNIMRDDSAILQEEILYGSGDPPTPYSRLHSHGKLHHPLQTKCAVLMLYLFHRASSFVPSVSTLLATQDSPNVSSTAFPGYFYQRCCYVALCVFNSSFRTLDPPTRTFIMPL